MTRIRSLDLMFRDALVQDCIKLGVNRVDIFRVIGTTHIGRMNAVALVKKWVHHINKTYPGSMTVGVNYLHIHDEYLNFMSCHNDMGTTEKERRAAWASMRSIINDG